MLDPDLRALHEIETPALVVNKEALQRNILLMARTAAAHGMALRPHAKTHKSTLIAKMQVEAGAIGISCATVAEMEAMAQANVDHLLLTAPVADRPKLARIAALAKRASVAVVVDHLEQVAALGSLLDDLHRPLRVLVDIDVGQKRTGVVDPRQTVALARAIGADTRMSFGGIQGFAGHVQHEPEAAARGLGAAAVAAILIEHRAALRDHGADVDSVTGSGTGAALFDVKGPYTELQVGSYVFMDADYGRLAHEDGRGLPYESSLFVLATVTSCNRPGQVTLDAGTKALAFNGPAPTMMIGLPQGSTYRFAGDEHGVIELPPGASQPSLGTRVLLTTTHCDPTVNLFGCYVVISANSEIERWHVAARHGG